MDIWSEQSWPTMKELGPGSTWQSVSPEIDWSDLGRDLLIIPRRGKDRTGLRFWEVKSIVKS